MGQPLWTPRSRNGILFFKNQTVTEKGNWRSSGCYGNRRGHRFYPVQKMPRAFLVQSHFARFKPARLIRLVCYYEQWLPIRSHGTKTRCWMANEKEKKEITSFKTLISFHPSYHCVVCHPVRCLASDCFSATGYIAPLIHVKSNKFLERKLLYESFQSA